MNTITIDSKILKKIMVSHEEVSQASKYYISPKVKALETGFRCPEDLSVDYKEELSGALAEKYL